MVERLAVPEDVVKQIMAMGYIGPHFPIKVGRGVFNKISLKCPYCGDSIDMSRIKGDVDSREHSVSVSGFGACGECKSWSPFDVRLRDDGSMLVRGEDGWGEVSLGQPSFFKRIVAAIFG